MENNEPRTFNILRYFSLASLVCILTTAILLVWLYRQTAINNITILGERGNVELAHSYLNAVHPILTAYLGDESEHHSAPLPSSVAEVIKRLITATNVVLVTIIDDEAEVVFSTKTGLIGSKKLENPGFRAAIAGNVHSKLTYHDHFNLGSNATEFDNQIRSYIPIRAKQDSKVLGVFAVDTEVGTSVAKVEQTQLLLLAGSVGILVILYLVLLIIVRRAARIIEWQEHAIRARTHTLELLSAQLINVQEHERQQVAHELHEGIAQTLSNLKYRLEGAYRFIEQEFAAEGGTTASLVLLVQDIIREVRTMAMDMHPSSLDDLGLLSTLEWYCGELQAVYSDLKMEQKVLVEEGDIPKTLKVVLYRLVQQWTQYLVHMSAAVRIRIQLNRADGMLQLELIDDFSNAELSENQRADSDLHLMILRERVTLSGGNHHFETNLWGGTTLRAEWPEYRKSSEVRL